MELMTGLEPVTSALPRQCATDCATSAYTPIVTSYYEFNTIIFYVFWCALSSVFWHINPKLFNNFYFLILCHRFLPVLQYVK